MIDLHEFDWGESERAGLEVARKIAPMAAGPNMTSISLDARAHRREALRLGLDCVGEAYVVEAL